MADYYAEFAGEERLFRLRMGEIVDLQRACDDVGVGAIVLRLIGQSYFVGDVFHILRLGLIGGGVSEIEARRMVLEKIDCGGLIGLADLAREVLQAVMLDRPKDETAPSGDPSEPFDLGAVLASFAKMGIAPDVVRRMDYRDFCEMMLAFGNRAQPPSEDELNGMFERYLERFPESKNGQ